MGIDVAILVVASICVVAFLGWMLVFILRGLALVVGLFLLGVSRLFGGSSHPPVNASVRERR